MAETTPDTAGTGASIWASVGERVWRVREPRRVGIVAAIFETPWDTQNKGADHTRTVARVDYSDGTYEHCFLDQLARVE